MVFSAIKLKKMDPDPLKLQNTVMIMMRCECFLHLAEFLSIRVGQECFEGLETCVDALHAPAFIAVGNLTADSSLLVLGRLRTEGDVGQAEGARSEERESHYSVHKGFVSKEKTLAPHKRTAHPSSYSGFG